MYFLDTNSQSQAPGERFPFLGRYSSLRLSILVSLIHQSLQHLTIKTRYPGERSHSRGWSPKQPIIIR
ncbi:hypothetical protein XM38_031540 [Halomicronema hongdechloris C2206]|uniref:Uncharacterized protein n=1 Tax=Halomicronema hongdechloris C2206 TaxID=1641165 RepID=A0A1Z3HPH7_9CYAN|nr:hypothetical protein XM38_031540 [Halomicronema hongdechloris C2206]